MNSKLSSLFCAVVGVLLTLPTHAEQMKNDIQIVRVEIDREELFSWVKQGTLFWLDAGREKEGGYLYRDGRGRMAVVSGNVAESSAMIGEQLAGVQQAEAFLRTKLAHIALSFLAPSHAHIVNQAYLKNRASLPDGAWWAASNKAEVGRSLEILKRYESTVEPVIKDGRWKLEFYVTLRNGSVEKWSMDGAVYPFAIDRCSKAVSEREGTVLPLPEV